MNRFAKQLSVFEERAEPVVPLTKQGWIELEMYFDFRLPDDFKDFVAEAAEYWFEGEIPTGRIDESTGKLEWLQIVKRERDESGNPIPNHLVPFCSVGNGDYHCFRILDRKSGNY